MRPLTGMLFVAFMSSALVLSGSAVTTAAPPIGWQPCAEQPEAECGTLTLPIDHARPGGEKFGLAVARHKATDPAKRAGVLLVNPGGPGDSGVDFAVRRAKSYFSREISERFDIVGFDPRGVSRSQPVTCSAALVSHRPSYYPKSAAEFDQALAYNQKLREDCATRSGPIFDHVSTADVVRDIDALRRALNEKKINYYGISYGTYLGQHYAERYGDKIRAMIIDSTMDHSLDTRRFVESEARAAEDSFREWIEWNDRTPSSPLHGEDVLRVWNDLVARAERGELTDPQDPGRRITWDELAENVLRMAYRPTWPQFAQQVARLASSAPGPRTAFAAQETVENSLAAIFCSDYDIRVSSYAEYQALTGLENLVAPNTRGSWAGHATFMDCIGFPKAANPQRALNIRNAPKILMTNAKHDPATAYEWAVNVHRQTRDTTVFVTYEGWGHGVYNRSECTRAINDRYLVSLTLPRTGTSCPAVEPVSPERQKSTVEPSRHASTVPANRFTTG